jgi:hypothetical protein
MKKIFIESNPYHDEILYALWENFHQAGDMIFNNDQFDLGFNTLLNEEIGEFTFANVVKLILFGDIGEIYITTLEDLNSIGIFLLGLLLNKKLFVVIHHADLVWDIGKKDIGFKAKLFRATIGKLVKKYARAYVLSDEVQRQIPGQTEVLSAERLSRLITPYITNKKDDTGWSNEFTYIGILGTINNKKRNYDLLLNLDCNILKNERIKIVILGKINFRRGSEFRQTVEEHGGKDVFTFFEETLKHKAFYTHIFYMNGLICPYGNSSYGNTMTSASRFISKGFNKPILEGYKNFRIRNADGGIVGTSTNFNKLFLSFARFIQ